MLERLKPQKMLISSNKCRRWHFAVAAFPARHARKGSSQVQCLTVTFFCVSFVNTLAPRSFVQVWFQVSPSPLLDILCVLGYQAKQGKLVSTPVFSCGKCGKMPPKPAVINGLSLDPN